MRVGGRMRMGGRGQMWISGRMRMGGWGPDADRRPNADGRPSQSRILLFSRPGDSSCFGDPAALATSPGAA